MKVIPAIDLMEGKVVRLYKGDPKQKTIYGNNPVEIAKKWEKNGADMLHIVDLDATLGCGSNLHIIKKIIENVTIPIEVAGGLRNEPIVIDVAQIANRVVLGTLAFTDKETFKANCPPLAFTNETLFLIITSVLVYCFTNKTITTTKKIIKKGYNQFVVTIIF